MLLNQQKTLQPDKRRPAGMLLCCLLPPLLATGSFFASLGLDPHGVDHLQYWRTGCPIEVRPETVRLGRCQPDRTHTVDITVHNRTETRVSVVGAEVECGCTTTAALPLRLPPYGNGVFTASFTPSPSQTGSDVELNIHLLLDVDCHPVAVPIRASVVSSSQNL